jgi:HEAT repeat protein
LIDPVNLKNLSNPSENIRFESIIKLIKSAEARVIPVFEKLAAKDPSIKIRQLARIGIAAIQKSSNWEKLSKVENAAVFSRLNQNAKIIYLENIGRARKTEYLPILIDILKIETSPFIISKTLNIIGIIGTKKNLPLLAQKFNDEDPRICAAAVHAMKTINHPGALLYLSNILSSDTDNLPYIVKKAIDALISNFNEKEILEYLQKVCSSQSIPTRKAVVEFIKKFGYPELKPILELLLNDDDVSIKESAAKSIKILERKKQIKEELDLDYFSISIEPESESDPDNLPRNLFEKIYHEDPKVRIMALQELIQNSITPEIEEGLLAFSHEEQNPHVLATLAKILGSVATPKTKERLLEFLKNEDPGIRANSIEGLMHFDTDEYSEYILPLLDDSSNRAKANAAIALIDKFPKKVFKTIESMSVFSEDTEKLSAIYAIQTAGTDQLVQLLPGLCSDTSPIVREHAFNALSVLASQGQKLAEAILSLESGNDEEDSKLCLSVVMKDLGISFEEMCTNMTKEKAELEGVHFNLYSPDEKERVDALRMLENIGDTSSLTEVQHTTRDNCLSVRQQAAKTFVKIKKRMSSSKKSIVKNTFMDIEELENVLLSSQRDSKIEILKKISYFDIHVLPVLLAHIKNEDDAYVKPILATVIGMLGDKGVAPYLIPYLSDKDPRVRANTVEAMEYLNDFTIYPHIIKCLDDSNKRVSENVLKALRNLGSQGVRKVLTSMMSSGNREFKESAIHTIATISAPWAEGILLDSILTDESIYFSALSLKSYIKMARSKKIKNLSKLKKIFLNLSKNKSSDKRFLIIKWAFDFGFKDLSTFETMLLELEISLPEITKSEKKESDLKTDTLLEIDTLEKIQVNNKNTKPGLSKSDGSDLPDFEKKISEKTNITKKSFPDNSIYSPADHHSPSVVKAISEAENNTAPDNPVSALLKKVKQGKPNEIKDALNALIHAKEQCKTEEVKLAVKQALHNTDLVVKFFAKKALDEIFNSNDDAFITPEVPLPDSQESVKQNLPLKNTLKKSKSGPVEKPLVSKQSLTPDLKNEIIDSKTDIEDKTTPPVTETVQIESLITEPLITKPLITETINIESTVKKADITENTTSLKTDPDELLSIEGCRKIKSEGNLKKLAHLIKELTNISDEELLKEVILLITYLDPEAGAFKAKKLLDHKSETIRKNIIELLTAADIQEYYPILIRYIDDDSREVRNQIIDIVCFYDGPSSKTHLKRLAGSQKAHNRIKAAQCLSLIQQEWAYETLELLCGDVDEKVREIAGSALSIENEI